jgi:hypothetical protein
MTQFPGLVDYPPAPGRGGRVANPWLSMAGQSGTTAGIFLPRLRSSPASYHSIVSILIYHQGLLQKTFKEAGSNNLVL